MDAADTARLMLASKVLFEQTMLDELHGVHADRQAERARSFWGEYAPLRFRRALFASESHDVFDDGDLAGAFHACAQRADIVVAFVDTQPAVVPVNGALGRKWTRFDTFYETDAHIVMTAAARNEDWTFADDSREIFLGYGARVFPVGRVTDDMLKVKAFLDDVRLQLCDNENDNEAGYVW